MEYGKDYILDELEVVELDELVVEEGQEGLVEFELESLVFLVPDGHDVPENDIAHFRVPDHLQSRHLEDEVHETQVHSCSIDSSHLGNQLLHLIPRDRYRILVGPVVKHVLVKHIQLLQNERIIQTLRRLLAFFAVGTVATIAVISFNTKSRFLNVVYCFIFLILYN